MHKIEWVTFTPTHTNFQPSIVVVNDVLSVSIAILILLERMEY